MNKGKGIQLHISQVFSQLPSNEGEFDFFNANLVRDSKLFIDPFLLKHSHVKEERELFDRFGIFFKKAYSTAISLPKDIHTRRKIIDFLSFYEPSELYLGYSVESSNGRGLAAKFARNLFDFFINSSISRLIDKDEIYPDYKFNPAILALITEGIGYDGISDLTGRLIMDYLVKYTQEQCKKWKIKVEKNQPIEQLFDFNNMEWIRGIYKDIPINPLNGKPIVFVPKHLLRGDEKIDPQKGKSGVLNILRNDPALTERFADLVVKNVDEVSMEEIHRTIDQEESIIKRYLEKLDKENLDSYDFEKDILGWLFVKTYEGYFNDTFLTEVYIKNDKDVIGHVLKFIKQFKDFIRNNGGWKDLWARPVSHRDGGCKEEVYGRLFHAMAVSFFCHYSNVKVIPQAGTGNGFMDFLFVCNRYSVAVELKNLSNSSNSGKGKKLPAYLHGIRKQLPEYVYSSNSKYAIYVTGQHYTGRHYERKNKKDKRKIRNDTPRVAEIKGIVSAVEEEIKNIFPGFEKLIYENIDLSPNPSPSKI